MPETNIDLGAICDNTTIQPNGGGVLCVPLADLVDGKTVFLDDDGKLTTEVPTNFYVFNYRGSLAWSGHIREIFESCSGDGSERLLRTSSILASLPNFAAEEDAPRQMIRGYDANGEEITSSLFMLATSSVSIIQDSQFFIRDDEKIEYYPPIELTSVYDD